MASPITSRHCEYFKMVKYWEKWRLAYDGGDCFITKYLRKLSARETTDDYNDRKCLAYVPAFAAAAIDDIKNSIIQRINEVTRVGGPDNYQDASRGLYGGVDYEGNTMNTFIGSDVILELLLQSKVGILVDNFDRDALGNTQADKGNKHPFIKLYRAEHILNWAPTHPIDGFNSVLLAETVDVLDEEYGLPTKSATQYRLMQKIEGGGVRVTLFDESYNPKATYVLDLERIPFHIARTARSLMDRVADHQIALMNLESSDISFARKANYPLYYEFYDAAIENPYLKQEGSPDGIDGADKSANKEVTVGMTQGRRFPLSENAMKPGFISPSPDSLRVSMEKEKELKNDIRAIVNLNLIALNPRRQSAESKQADNTGLEASLSYLAQTLESLERLIAEDWSAFERTSKIATIVYPKTYSIKTDEQRRKEVTELAKVSNTIPSKLFQREIRKEMARVLLGNKISYDKLEEIYGEIESAKVLNADPNVILTAHKQALVSSVTASDSLGFEGEEEIEQAKKDRAEQIALAMEAQGGPDNMNGNRGVHEMDKGVPPDEKAGKQQRGSADHSNQAGEIK